MSVITVQQAVKHSDIRKQTSTKKTVFEQGQFSLWQNVVLSMTSERIQYFIMCFFGSSVCNTNNNNNHIRIAQNKYPQM